MARTLTDLTPVLYAALDTVSQELVGLIPAVTLDAAASRAAVGQSVKSPVSAAATASDNTAGDNPPDAGDNSVGTAEVIITKSRGTSVRVTGEDQAALASGIGWQTLAQAEFAQGMRTLVNEIESDLALLYKKASRAYGTAGTTPFATAGDFSDAAEVRRLLVDNGAPLGDLQLVLNSAAGAKFRGKQAQAQMLGSSDLQRSGLLAMHEGLMLRESAQIKTHTIGTGASVSTSAAAAAVGATSLVLDAAGTGTVVAGDVIAITGDSSNLYVVTTGDTDVSDGGTIVIGAPGLRVAKAAAKKAITIGAAYAANMAFARSAIILLARAPAMPAQGDAATDAMLLTHPASGLTFEIREYRQYMRVHYRISIAWGCAVAKPEHLAILLG